MTIFYRLLGFLRPYKRGMIISWTLASLAMVMTVALPALTGRAVQIISTGAQHQHAAARASDRHELTLIAGAIALIVLMRWGFMYWRRMVAGRLSLGVEYDLRKLLYGHLQELELGFFDRQQTGQLMSRATVDLQAVRFFLGYGLVFILQSILTIVLAGIVMIVIEPRLGADLARARAVRGADLLPLRPPRAPGDPGDPAAHRRADRGRRGEHLRGARRQGLRARAAPARALPGQRRARLQPGDGRHPPGSEVQPDDRLPAPARPRRGAVDRAATP